MALAGYVAFGSLQRSPALPFAARRAVNLLLPVFTRTLIGYGAMVGIFSLQNFPQALATFGNLFFGSLWFFWALFFSSIIVAAAKKFQIDNFLCAGGSVGLVLLLVPEAHNLYLFKFTLPFFWIGYFAAKYSESWRKFAENKFFLAAAFGGAVASYFFMGYPNLRLCFRHGFDRFKPRQYFPPFGRRRVGVGGCALDFSPAGAVGFPQIFRLARNAQPFHFYFAKLPLRRACRAPTQFFSAGWLARDGGLPAGNSIGTAACHRLCAGQPVDGKIPPNRPLFLWSATLIYGLIRLNSAGVLNHSRKFTNCTATGNSCVRTAAMTVCNSSRLLLFTRTSSP